jgi:autotransporter-associated beta strand protein
MIQPTQLLQSRLNSLVAALAIVLVASMYQSARAETWTGTGANALWTTGDNWDTLAAPGAGAAILFDGSSSLQLNNTMGAAFTVNSLTFGPAQTAAVTINTVNTAALTFNPGTILNVSAGNHRFLGSNGGSGTSADWAFTTASVGTPYVFSVASGASFEIAGRFASGGTSRTYNKIGGGTLILAGNNGGSGSWNYNSGGRFNVAEGVLRLASTAALGNTSNPYSVSNGAVLEFAGPAATTVTHNQSGGAHTVAGTGINGGGALRNVSGNTTLTGGGAGSINLVADSSFGVDADKLTVGLKITGVGSLTKVGAGVLQLNSAANDYAGGTIVSAGTLIANNSSALSTGNVTVNGGLLEILSSGAGTLTLGSGANFSMTDGSVGLLLGTSFDRIMASGGGAFSITGGSLSLDVSGAGFDYNDSYAVFSGFSSGSVSGLAFFGHDNANYTPTLSDSGVLSFALVPEPSTAALAVLGLALLGWSGRKQHRGVSNPV